MDTVDRTYVNAGTIFGIDAGFSNHVWHRFTIAVETIAVTGPGRLNHRTNVVDDSAGACVLDVRPIPIFQRHALVFERFDRLADGESLLLVTDHEPRPLRAEFEQRRCGLYAWEQYRTTDLGWEATIRKLALAECGDRTNILLRCTVFADLERPWLDALASRARVAHVKRNRAVVEQGIVWPYVAVVSNGLVQAVLVTPGGREFGISELLTGEIFGVTALIDGGGSPLRYVARSKDTGVLLLPIDAVNDVMHSQAGVARAIDAQRVRGFRGVLDRFSFYSERTITARVAETLLAYASPLPGLVVALPPLQEMRQVDLAVSAGTAKDMVYRAIAELEEAGALSLENARIVSLDRGKLTRFSQVLKY